MDGPRRSKTIGRLLGCALLAVMLSPSILAAEDATVFDKQRAAMVRQIELGALATGVETGIEKLDERVLAAMRSVPRHLFVPEPLRGYAYRGHPLPLGHDQNIASPFLIALMTHLAELKKDDVVYETGTGAGYHAAVLAHLASKVYSVEVVEPLARKAAKKLSELNVDNTHTRHGDGYYGWAEKAPFDAIIVKEALDHLPVPLINQLRPGGRMVVPLSNGGNGQYLTVVRKQPDGTITKMRILPVVFSPLQGGERT